MSVHSSSTSRHHICYGVIVTIDVAARVVVGIVSRPCCRPRLGVQLMLPPFRQRFGQPGWWSCCRWCRCHPRRRRRRGRPRRHHVCCRPCCCRACHGSGRFLFFCSPFVSPSLSLSLLYISLSLSVRVFFCRRILRSVGELLRA